MREITEQRPMRPPPQRRDVVFECDDLEVSYGDDVALQGVTPRIYRNS